MALNHVAEVDAPAPPAAPAEIEHSEAPNDYRADLAAAFRASAGRAPTSDAEDQLAEVVQRLATLEDLVLTLIDDQTRRRAPAPALPPGARTMSLLDRRPGGNGNDA